MAIFKPTPLPSYPYNQYSAGVGPSTIHNVYVIGYPQTPTHPTFDKFMSYNKPFFLDANLDMRKKCIKKWEPIVENMFDEEKTRLSASLMEHMCYFLELCSSYADIIQNIGYIKNQMGVIIENIKSLKDNRSDIIGKSFNYTTGKLEYKLVDGNYISTVESEMPKLNDISILPDIYVKYVDISKYRDMKIDEII